MNPREIKHDCNHVETAEEELFEGIEFEIACAKKIVDKLTECKSQVEKDVIVDNLSLVQLKLVLKLTFA